MNDCREKRIQIFSHEHQINSRNKIRKKNTLKINKYNKVQRVSKTSCKMTLLTHLKEIHKHTYNTKEIYERGQ